MVNADARVAIAANQARFDHAFRVGIGVDAIGHASWMVQRRMIGSGVAANNDAAAAACKWRSPPGHPYPYRRTARRLHGLARWCSRE